MTNEVDLGQKNPFFGLFILHKNGRILDISRPFLSISTFDRFWNISQLIFVIDIIFIALCKAKLQVWTFFYALF